MPNTTTILARDLEIVGLNGAAMVECGRALPIARRKSDGRFAVLDVNQGATRLNWHADGEAAALLAQGRWTKFTNSVDIPWSCCDPSRQHVIAQPMVVYADITLLENAGHVARPQSFADESLTWRRLESRPETMQAACASAATVEKLLDDWGNALLQRFDVMCRDGRDREYLRRIADFALSAARNKPLRWKAFQYYATVQEPERVRSTFDTFIQREFPAANWSEFLETVSSLREVFERAPIIPFQAFRPSSEPSIALSKIRGMAADERDSAEAWFAA